MSDEKAKIDPRCKYRDTHEWVRAEGGEFLCGISHHAEHALGDVVFLELPAPGKSLKQGEVFGVIESVKAASDLYMPLSGTILAVNVELVKNPATVNQDSYDQGWMLRFAADDPSELDALLSPEDYAKLVAE